ncbi:hypothetical protein ACQ5SO_08275 [Rhodovulum sp. DZ06]|uniref:hypothetical protein n=1 Tax=Rhodovulum sp. DZ06 TaxID=3425126 RepID=UPI003D358ACB
MSIQRLHGSAAAVALAAAAGVALAAVGAIAQEDAEAPARGARVGAIPEARPLSEALSPAEIARLRAAEAEAAAAAEAQAAEDAAAAEAEAAEAAAEEEEEEPTLAARRGPSLGGFGAGAVNQDPERRFDLTLSTGVSFNSGGGSNTSDSIVSANTNARLMYTSVTSDSALNIGLSAGFRALGGNETDRNVVPIPDLSVGYSQAIDSTTSFSTSFSARLDQVAFTEADTISIITDPTSGLPIGFVQIEGDEGDALKLALGAGMSLSHAINPRNQLSFGLNLSRTDYVDETSPALSSSTAGSLSLSWSHQSQPTLSHSLSAVTSVSQTDNAADQRSLTVAVTGGANWSVNRRLSMQGSLGPSLTFSQRTVGGVDETFTSPGVRALAGLTYSGARSSLSASFSNAVNPDSDGAGIANITAFTIGGRLQLDADSSVGANASLGWQQALSGDENSAQERLTAATGVSFSTRLFDEISASVGYRLSWSDENAGSDVSHRVSLTFSRGFTFLP